MKWSKQINQYNRISFSLFDWDQGVGFGINYYYGSLELDFIIGYLVWWWTPKDLRYLVDEIRDTPQENK